MNLVQLESTLKQVTGECCGHEVRQGVLGMSNLYLPADKILENYRNGFHPDEEQKLKLFQGTHSELGMRNRLSIVCERLGLAYGEPRVISAFDGRLTGHVDGSIGEHVVEIKTVPDLTILKLIKADGRLPFKVLCQVNAYMLWGPYQKSLVIYETRNEGALWVVEVLPGKRLQSELELKAALVLSNIDIGKVEFHKAI